MKTERPLWPQPAAPEVRAAAERAPDQTKAAMPGAEVPARPDIPAGPSVKAGTGRDRNWRWPQTLRFAIVVSGLFWLVIGLCVWAYLNAG